MPRSQNSGLMIGTLYVLLMIAVVATVDVLFFRDHVRERMVANIAIVAIFGVVYFKFVKRG